MKKGSLGMGLDALFSDNTSDIQVKKTLRLSEIEPNRAQPRKDFDEDTIASLAESLKEHGIIQPLVVRPYNGSYQIVAGERRWRAARMLGLTEVPVIIKELTDLETIQLALVENLQREDLNPVEEALSMKELQDKFDMTQEDIARVVGKSRPAVANSLRMLSLSENIIDMIRNGLVSVGHAKLLLSVEDEEIRDELAKRVADGELTVRALEVIVTSLKAEKKNKKKTEKKPDSYFKEMEISLKERLGRKVKVVNKSGSKGTIVLEFYDKDDLNSIAQKLIK